MKKTFLYFFLFLSSNILSAQNISLSDTVFTSSFKEDIFYFTKIHPMYVHWQLIAGRCNSDRKERTNEEIDSFNRYSDSLFQIFIIKQQSLGFLCQKRIDLLVEKCLKANHNKKDKGVFCDSLSALKGSKYGVCKEINEQEWNMVENMQNDFYYDRKYNTEYTYKSSKQIGKLTATVNKCNIEGYGTWCPPGFCNWFILAYETGRPKSVNHPVILTDFLGKIDNPYKAYLVLIANQYGDSGPYPQDNTHIKYKKINDTFYFISRLRLSDCPVQMYDCLISINKIGKIEMIDKVKIGEGGGCI